MPNSFGLIDNAGNIIRGSGDYTVVKDNGVFELRFNRNVKDAVVVVSHHHPFCDALGGESPIQIGKKLDDQRTVCVMFVDDQFSFILTDDGDIQTKLTNMG
jgi:hypothetical protein